MLKIIQNIGNKQSRKVTEEDMQTVRDLIRDIQRLCNKPLGPNNIRAEAIAHCQVDQSDPMRFFVLKDGTTYVNPHIIERIGKPIRNMEGCMSYANADAKLSTMRYKKLRIKCTVLKDPFCDPVDHRDLVVTGLLAFIMQHEIDHMNGKHIYDKMRK